MSVTEKTVSALVSGQLPDFVRADHPKFQRFAELYYQWLETNGSTANYDYGNTVFHIMNSDKYRDVDNTLDPFIRLFKSELLPYFPEKTALDLTKILKGAREFYVRKGSEESLKWLFKALYAEDIQVFYPKKQILIASDGKWKLPKAFNLTISDANININPNLLEKHQGMGSISKATCTIESANRTIDKTFGTEILEIYVTNVVGEFTNGEDLQVTYVDAYGATQFFSEKIVGSISNIKVDSNILTDPDQKRRGLTYNVGDPVVVFGGLDNTNRANDAVAIVGNVSMGSIEGVSPIFPGYGYRISPDTDVIVYRSAVDDPNANLSTEINLAAINTIDSSTNSQQKFLETIDIDLMPIEYLSTVQVGASDYTTFTACNRNIVINVTEDLSNKIYYTYDDVWANGASYETANFKGKILTTNTTSGFGAGGAAYTGTLLLYSVSNTKPLNTTGFVVGQKLYTRSGVQKSFTINSVPVTQLAANASSSLLQVLNYQTLTTGGVALFNIINGGYGFRQTPSIGIASYFDTYWSLYDTTTHNLTRQPIGAFGKIAHIYIDNQNPGTGYANGDQIVITGRGYGFSGYVNVNTTGAIINTTIVNRGEGYKGSKTVTVTSSAGSNAVLTAFGFGEGATVSVETGAIGRVKDYRVISRGYDYISTPIVSLKVVDMVISAIPENKSLTSGERVYQGASLKTASFQGIVKSYNRTTRVLRLFNYSGASFSNFNSTTPFTSEGGVTFSVDTTAKVPAPAAVPSLGTLGDPYASVRATGGLPNPWFYGNGRAKAVAEFYNGLIKFPGFYVNTDGFLSADKKTQDGTTYHNFSYIIESALSLADFSDTVLDVVHPAGAKLLAKTIIGSDFEGANTKSNSTITVSGAAGTNLTAYAFDTSGRAIITNNMTFTANTGDLIRIGSMSSERYLVKQITSVSNTNASPTLSLDFANGSYDLFPANSTIITLESNTMFIGDGRLSTTNNSNTVVVSNNVLSLSPQLSIGDYIRFKIPEYRTNKILYSQDVSNTAWNKSAANVQQNILTYSEDFSNTAWTKANVNIQQNLLKYTEDFSNTAWTKANVEVITGVADPYGNLTATSVTANANNAELTQTISILAGTPRVSSMWIRRRNGSNAIAMYGATANTVITSQVSNTWSRVNVSSSAGSSSINCGITLVMSGDAVDIWHPQINFGGNVENYQATTLTALPILYPNPLGTGNTAMKVFEDAATTSTHSHAHAYNLNAGAAYTYSIYVSASERTKASITFDGTTFAFDIGAGTTGSPNATITSVGGGWYRLSCYRAALTTAVGTVYTYLANASASTSYAGDGLSGMLFYGAQINYGSTAQTYTATTSLPLPISYSDALSGNNAQSLICCVTGVTTVYQNSLTAKSTSATYSVYVKQGSGSTDANYFALRNSTTSTTLIICSIDYTNGVVTQSTGSTGTSVYSVNAGNGWWRIVLTASTGISVGDTLMAYPCFVGNSETVNEYAYVFGAQLEDGDFPTEYVPTTSVTVKSANISANTVYTANVINMVGNYLTLNTPSGIITSNNTNLGYQIFPTYDTTTYKLMVQI